MYQPTPFIAGAQTFDRAFGYSAFLAGIKIDISTKCSRSPTMERYREVTPRRRRFSPSSGDVINPDKSNLVRPRSLVLDSVETSFGEPSLDEMSSFARPMKKYKSVVVLRESSSSQRFPAAGETSR